MKRVTVDIGVFHLAVGKALTLDKSAPTVSSVRRLAMKK